MASDANNRVYIKVASVIDKMGFILPQEVIWADGRVFPIESVEACRPMVILDGRSYQDCYTVIIRGKKKQLFFERIDTQSAQRVGRWFVKIAE